MRGFVGTLAGLAITAALAGVAGCASSSSLIPSPPASVPPATTPPSAKNSPAVVLDEHANQTTVRVTVGRQVELLLHSSYWTDFGSSRSAVVRADGPSRVLPAATHCVPGGGCNPVVATFTAMSAGTAVLSASRTSCGEALRCGPDNSHYHVTIIVTG